MYVYGESKKEMMEIQKFAEAYHISFRKIGAVGEPKIRRFKCWVGLEESSFIFIDMAFREAFPNVRMMRH